MPPKKRKVNFDIEELGRGYEQIQQWFSKLKSSLDDCCLSDAADILSPDNILSLSGLKFGFRFVENLMSILSVVPEEAGPWRSEIILVLLNTLQSPNELSPEQKDVALFISQSIYKNGFAGHRQCYSEVFSHVLNFSNHLQSNQSSIASLLPFAGCIGPPTKTCLLCHQELQKNNKPCIITHYLVNGPLPFLKVELRCRTCRLSYGITKYGNNEDGYKFYDSSGTVEASNVVYVDRLVMSLFASLR